jgi:hypothetical protein
VELFGPGENGLADLAADFQQLAMHVQNVLRSGPFVQVINVLSDQQNPSRPFFFQPRQGKMGGIGLNRRVGQLRSTGVVKGLDQVRIAGKPLGRGDIL